MNWQLNYLAKAAELALPQQPQNGPQRPPLNPQDAQLAQEYQNLKAGTPQLQGAMATLPPPIGGTAPVNVVQIIWKAVRKAAPDLLRNGIQFVRLDHLPGNAIGLNKSHEPHIIHLDPFKIGQMQEQKAINEFQLKHKAGDQMSQQQRLSALNKLIQDSIEHEALATIFHEDEHEEQFRTLLRNWMQRGGPLMLNVPEGPAKARENMAGPEPIVASKVKADILPQLSRRNKKTAMATRSGFPELDKAIEEFMRTHEGLDAYRDPQNAWGQCELVAKACADFLKQRGFRAYCCSDDLEAFFGYENAKDTKEIGAGDFTYLQHSVVEVYGLPGMGVNTVTIDFTAGQYGFTEFPKVHPGPRS